MFSPCGRTKKAPLSGRPHVLAAAAAVAVALAAAPAAVAVTAAVAEDQQQDDDPPPVVATEAPADPIVVSTHNRYLRSFCWASLPTLHVMTAALFCAAPPLAGYTKRYRPRAALFFCLSIDMYTDVC